jgi:hypothetical protein
LLDEHKELFLLKKELFEELITKTTLMCNESNTEDMVAIFNSVLGSKPARLMKYQFYKANGLTEEKVAQINRLAEDADTAPPAGSEGSGSDNFAGGGGAPAGDTPEGQTGKGGDDDSASDLDTEELNKIIDIFKKIKDAISADKKADQETIDYIDGLISSLDAAKVKGMDDSKMKEIIDFLSTAGESKDSDEGDKDDKDGDKTAGSDDDQVDI